MSTITIIGGTGYTGTNLAREAHERGHRVVAFSRNPPQHPVAGVDYRQGSTDDAVRLVADSDVVVATLSPRGDSAGTLLDTYRALAGAAAEVGARLVVVGGFSSLRPAPGEPRFAEGDLDEQFRDEALEMESVRRWLAEQSPAELAWVFVSPAGGYGAWAPGERTGSYRIGSDVALTDAEGRSEISGPDFAVAIVDEIERPQHPREHIGVAY